ncbi:MAG: aminoacyl-tRNA hydrolase [Candidatus Zixiibacteriota bacterium]|nr:MAG: aminoacyl-tRNA hydrolase [candidate division Zixibacteria bacterium]
MIRLVVGLGNPGSQYEGTRHNIGLEVLTRSAQLLQARPQPQRGLYQWASAGPDANCLVLASPRTFMNRSGDAVSALLHDFEFSLSEMLVLVDDFNLALGAVRIRAAGSDGGHHGLASIIQCLGTDSFARLRAGIGQPADNVDAADYVLSHFEPADAEKVREMVDRAAEATIFAVHHRLEETMTRYNYNPAPSELP